MIKNNTLMDGGDAPQAVQRAGGVTTLVDPLGNQNKFELREKLSAMVPKIIMGVNGTMVTTANLASKTDGLQGAINIINTNKANKTNGVTSPQNGLEDPLGMPLRVIPAQLSMTTKGCPVAQLYQQYFIDFQTGTTLDNIYNCTNIQHSISPGKFDTSWTFAYQDGYGKFSGAPSFDSVATQELEQAAARRAQEEADQKQKQGGGAGNNKKK
jgi:hypothetical protein